MSALLPCAVCRRHIREPLCPFCARRGLAQVAVIGALTVTALAAGCGDPAPAGSRSASPVKSSTTTAAASTASATTVATTAATTTTPPTGSVATASAPSATTSASAGAGTTTTANPDRVSRPKYGMAPPPDRTPKPMYGMPRPPD